MARTATGTNDRPGIIHPKSGRRSRQLLVAGGAVSVALLAAACGSAAATPPSSSGGGGATTQPASSPAASSSNAVLKTSHNAKLGTILVTAKGFTLYTYKADTATKSACVGQCAQIWPPLVVSGSKPPTVAGLSGLTIVMRADGKHQVAWDGHPLYTFASDKSAGQATGQGVNGFSVAITKASSQSTQSTTTTAPAGGGY
ncbi:MAG: COG4315 family predicted lipoprotein [Acidimicrobiales bacterium]